MSNLRNIIRELARPDTEASMLVCTVDAVDKDTRTIDCSPIDESAPLLGVNLQANQQGRNGICVFPKKGSFVVVGLLPGGVAGVMLLSEEIESVQICIGNSSVILNDDGLTLNGGSLGGLVKVNELTAKLNELVAAFNSHTHTGSCPSGAVSTLSPVNPATYFNAADYENHKIKQ